METPLRVLLVDDDEDDCALTSAMVARIRTPRAARMTWVGSYEAGLEALLENRSDVCLLDYRLGARDGLDLLRQARSLGCVCPFIVLTGQGADGADELAMSLGADDYLGKADLTVPLLERAIRYAVERGRHVGALRASEARYRRLFEATKDGILILSAETQRIVDANPFISELTGCPREAFIGKFLWEIGPFKDAAAAKDSFAELLANDYVRYDDLPLTASGGRIVTVEFVSSVYLVNGERVIQCNIRDITARRTVETELRMRDRAIEAVAQGIIITDARAPDAPTLYASPGFVRLTGYPAEEVLGKNCRLLQGRDTDPASTSLLHEAQRAGRACVVELLNYRKDGSPFWNSLALSPIRDERGVLVQYIGVQTDVTARRQLEAQLLQSQKMEAVGRLAGGVAHDFNNMLSVILSYTEMIRSSLTKDDPVSADIGEIRTAALRAADLTRQLLAFSRQQVLEAKVLNLNEVLGKMERMLARLLGADISLTVLPAPGLSNVQADPGQLEQIVMNLAVNARDAMLTGGQLTLETANVDLDEEYAVQHDVPPGPYVELTVSDTGIGMDRATRGRIFEPFFTTKDKSKGTGLGLATVFGIVKQSGGHIVVDSEPGAGTTFKIYLPTVAAEVDAPALTMSLVVEGERTGGTILLVEDEEQVRVVARTLLRRQGYVVLDAQNGGEALLISEQYGADIDLLLTDVVLPRMSGRQLAERLAPARPSMRVLYMSGYTDDAVLRHGIIHSGAGFLQKPITPALLAQKVRDTLRGTPSA
jgi:two-component system cell cycle sensor histidine kinase/response regulator CckA